MATTTTSQTNTTQIPPASDWENYARQMWLQALQSYNPLLQSMTGQLGTMSGYVTPQMFASYAGILGGQGQQGLAEVEAQGQINQLLQQLRQAQQSGQREMVTELQNQIQNLPGGMQALSNEALYNNVMALSGGALPQLSADAQAQVSALGQAYETAGMTDIDRARENATRQWRENVAQRGLYKTDTPSQAAFAPVESELARQTANIGAGRGALEAQTRLNLAQQMPAQSAALEQFRQSLAQQAQTNRTQLASAAGNPWQQMFSNTNSLLGGVGNAGQGFGNFAGQLGNLRLGQATQNITGTQTQPWTTQIQPWGQLLQGAGQFLGSPGVSNGLSSAWNFLSNLWTG